MPADKWEELSFPPITLNRQTNEPLYQQLADRIREHILNGTLKPGTRLPPARQLARQLNVNTVTTVHAYRALAAAKLTRSRVGSGTFVCIHCKNKEHSGTFPLGSLKQVIADILDQEGTAAFAYDDLGGYPPLHRSLRTYLSDSGFALGPDETVIVSGAQQGLSVISRALIRPGDWVLVERPTYPRVLRILQRSGARIECLDVDDGGPDIGVMERLFATRPFRLAYVMPTYHTPTGYCYSDAQKRALHDLCTRYRVTLVEDDAFSDIDYGPGRQTPLRALCGSGQDIIYLKSFSHIMLPGFRLGFCLCPPGLAAVLREAKEEADLFSSGFFQRVLNAFLEQGHFARRVSALEDNERVRFANILRTAAQFFPGAQVDYVPPQGGSSLWCRLPKNADSAVFHAACVQEGIQTTPGREFTLDSSRDRYFAICHTDLDETEWADILRKLVACLTRAGDNKVPTPARQH